MSKGTKHDEGKARYDLIDADWLEGVALGLTSGKKEHGPYNWQNVAPWRFRASIQRHMAEINKGNHVDSDTGLLHANLVGCNAMFLSWHATHNVFGEWQEGPSFEPMDVKILNDQVQDLKDWFNKSTPGCAIDPFSTCINDAINSVGCSTQGKND